MSKKRRDAIAYHEAGHAVVALALGMVVETILAVDHADQEIDGEKGNRHHKTPLHQKILDCTDKAEEHRLLNEYLAHETVISLAGEEAQRRLDSRATKGARGDMNQIHARFDKIDGITQKDREQFIRIARRDARKFVEEGWPANERIAAALIERGRLSKEEIERLASSH